MSKFVDILEGMNLSPPGVLGLAGVFDADLEAGDFDLLGVFDGVFLIDINSLFFLEVFAELEDDSTLFFIQRGAGPLVIGSSILTALLRSLTKVN